MSMLLFSPRAAVAGLVGAGALSGALLFGAVPTANAAQAPAGPAAAAGSSHVTLTGHHDHHRHDLHHSVNIL